MDSDFLNRQEIEFIVEDIKDLNGIKCKYKGVLNDEREIIYERVAITPNINW